MIVSADSVATDRDGIPAIDHGAADIFDLPSDLLAQDACATDCSGSSASAAPHTVDVCEERIAHLALWTLCSPQRNSAYFIIARPPQLPCLSSPLFTPPHPTPPRAHACHHDACVIGVESARCRLMHGTLLALTSTPPRSSAPSRSHQSVIRLSKLESCVPVDAFVAMKAKNIWKRRNYAVENDIT